MSLYFMKARDKKDYDRVRKHYADGAKLELNLPYYWHLNEKRMIHSSELDARSYGEALRTIRGSNLPWVMTTARTYTNLDKFDDATCKRGNPLTDGEGGFRKKLELLEDEHLNHACLDLDSDHPLVSEVFTPDIASYVRISKSALPILVGRELVAFFSSSIVNAVPGETTRMNLRVVVFFDKPYPRETVKRWVKSISRCQIDGQTVEFVDPALVGKATANIVANPVVNGEISNHEALSQIHIEDGSKITINVAELSTPGGQDRPAFDKNLSDLDKNLVEREAYWLGKNKRGELRGNRHRILYQEIFREVALKGKYEAKHLVSMFDANEQIKSDKDVWAMYEDACFYLYNTLTGKEFGGLAHDKKYLDLLDMADFDIKELDYKNKVIGLKSGCGTNKTKGFIKELIKDAGYKRVLYISLLKATIEPTTQDISFKDEETGLEVTFAYYEANGRERSAKEAFCRTKDYLTITNKSLSVLIENGRLKPFDLVVIDEAEQVAMNSVDIQASQAELFDFCNAAQTVLLLDADATDDLTGWLGREIADKAKNINEFVALINNKDWMSEGHRVHELTEEKDVYGIIDKLLKNDKRVYLHVSFKDKDERRKISAICRYFKKRYPQKTMLGFDSASAPKGLRKSANRWIDNKIRDDGIDLLIHSPWSKIGWDYLGDNTFDACVGYYPSRNMTAPDIAQATRRMRLTKLHYIYIGTQQQQKGLPQEWYDNLFEDEFGLRHAETVGITINHKKQLAELSRKRRRIQQTNIREHFEAICRERGAYFIKDFSTDQDKEGVEELLEECAAESQLYEAKRLFESYKRRHKIIDKYYQPDDNSYEFLNDVSEARQGLVEIEDFDEFYDLYIRDIKNENFSGDIEELSRIWFANAEERVLLDLKDDQYMAVLQSLILDKVDELLGMDTSDSNNHGFLDFVRSDYRTELHVLYTNEQYRPIVKIIKDFEDRLREALPHVRVSEAKGKFEVLVEDIANMFDLSFTSMTVQPEEKKITPKKVSNAQIISYYRNNGLLTGEEGPRSALQKSEQNIEQKVRTKAPLSTEEQIHAGYMGHYVILRKYKLINKNLDLEIREGCRHEIFEGRRSILEEL